MSKKETYKVVDPKVTAYHEQLLTVMRMHADLPTLAHIAVLSQTLGQVLRQHDDPEGGIETVLANMKIGTSDDSKS